MAAAPLSLPASEWGRTSPRRRAASFVAALVVHLLLLALLLNLAPPWEIKAPAGSITVIPLPPSADEQEARRPAKAAKRDEGGAPPAKAVPIQPPPPLPTVPNQPAAPWVLNPELQSFNLAQVPRSAPAAQTGQSAGESQGNQTGAGDSGGGAPGSGRLFPVRWYREPTATELNPYLPRNHPAGWGEIACRTTERFHVEDCQEIGQSPAGSGLSRAVREAAWQFLVRPPRLNGKDLVGAPVRIRIDYYENGSIGLGGGGGAP